MVICPSCAQENPDGAKFCMECATRLEVTPVEEVRKTVTVIFCDVTGSTAMGERLDPEALRRVMMRYFEAMTEAIERHGGTVEKFIGDAVMAVFGIPTMHEDDALRAVRAAEDMRRALPRLNEELQRDQGATLACRIGVNTGEVVAGEASVRQALVTGDTVNVAARLEQAARPGEVLIAEPVLRLVHDGILVEAVEPLELKGKSERVPAFRLIEVYPDAVGVGRHLESPLVGRRRQLAQLQQAFEEVTSDRVCHLFTVLGPPGVGKSRLVQEALDRLPDDVTVLRGRCLSYGEGITYWPIIEVVRDALGPGASPDIAAAIIDLLPDEPSIEQVASQIAAVAGGGKLATTTDEDVAWAVRRLFEALARRGPLLVVLDDAHWAEAELLDLIDQIADWSRDSPILLICLGRPELLEQRPGWGGGKLHATTVALESLAPEEVAELIEHYLSGAVDPALEERIAQATEGNPLFVEETLAMLLDDGVVRREADRWVAPDLHTIAVPPTIHALLAARLDRLEDAERAVLGRASVIGHVFYLDALRDLASEQDREATARQVQRLVRRDLIRPETADVPGEEAFRFHHALLCDAAYQMLSKEARSGLHERFAAWLETRTGIAELDEFAGYHLERAYMFRTELGAHDERARTLAARAAAHLSAAATRARDRGAGLTAAALYERANALRSPDDPARVRDLLSAGWALTDVNHEAESKQVFEEALQAARTAGDEGLLLHAELGVAWSRSLVDPEGASGAVGALVERALPRFEALGLEEEQAIAYVMRSQIHWVACRFGAARDDCDRAIPHALAAGSGQWVRIAAATRNSAGALGGARVEDMLADLDDFRTLVLPSPRAEANVATGRGWALAMLGRFDEAWVEFDRAIRLERESSDTPRPGFFEARAASERLAGLPDAAAASAAQGFELLTSFGDVAHASSLAGECGLGLVQAGREDEAARWSAVCRETSASDDVVNQHIWRRIDAVIAARQRHHEEAASLIAEAVEWVRRTDQLLDVADIALCEAEIHARAGRPDEAEAALGRALASFEEKGATVGAGIVTRRRNELGLG